MAVYKLPTYVLLLVLTNSLLFLSTKLTLNRNLYHGTTGTMIWLGWCRVR